MRILLVAILALAPMFVHASERDTIINTVDRVSKSVGALYAQTPGGDINFLCSATAIERWNDKTVILTAHHCLQRGVAYLINFGDNKLHTLTAWKVPHYEVDAEKFPRKYNEPETDMALFLMDGHDVPTVQMADSSRVKRGAKVVMVGYPLGVSKISYEGSVAGRFDRVGADQYNYLLLQIFGSPGSSGSSVVDVDTGEIVGILVSAKQAMSGLPVIFATPVEYRQHLIEVAPTE